MTSTTKKLQDKTYSLYRSLLRTGYDPEFDDDIIIEGTLTFVVDSWEKNDRPEMTAQEMNMWYEFEEGKTWCNHPAFEGICICHTIYNLTDFKLFSFPDVLRMNDFWCEIKVNHQMLCDLKGKRYSIIDQSADDVGHSHRGKAD